MKYSIAVRALLPVAIWCLTAASTYGAANGWVETFENGLNGWLAYDMINEKEAGSLTIEAGVAVLSLPPQTIPMPPEEHVLRADAAASGGAFTGNYKAAGVNALAFRILPESDAILAVLIENTDARHRWRYDLTGLVQGQWTTVLVRLGPELAPVHSGGTDELAADLQNVSWIGVLVKRGSALPGQVTRLDDFRLLTEADLDYQMWVAETTGHRAWQLEMLPPGDLDGDGMVNEAEYVAGTDAADSKDVFSVSATEEANGVGMLLQWASVEGRTYRVLRALQPGGPYVPITGRLAATTPVNRYSDNDSVEATGRFYKIEVTRSE